MTGRDMWQRLLARVESQAVARREAVAERLAERLAGEYPDLEVTRQGSMVTLSGKALRERRAREAGLRWPGWGG